MTDQTILSKQNIFDLKCLIDTESTINMLTRNIFQTPIPQTNHLIHTSNGPLTINEAATIPLNIYFPIAQEFLIHKFSDHYDMLIGRKLLF